MNNKRRSFLKKGLILTAGTALLPSYLSSQNLNSKLNIAVIGVGGRGFANYSKVFGSDNIVAMCDVDDNRAKNGYKKVLENHTQKQRVEFIISKYNEWRNSQSA